MWPAAVAADASVGETRKERPWGVWLRFHGADGAWGISLLTGHTASPQTVGRRASAPLAPIRRATGPAALLGCHQERLLFIKLGAWTSQPLECTVGLVDPCKRSSRRFLATCLVNSLLHRLHRILDGFLDGFLLLLPGQELAHCFRGCVEGTKALAESCGASTGGKRLRCIDTMIIDSRTF
jgi:hypothetical protein